ncbi:MAG: hypothetical protein ROR55_28745 [Devosia sp.]
MFLHRDDELWLTDFIYFQSPFGLRSEHPATFFVIDEWHMYNRVFYRDYIWELIVAHSIKSRKWEKALQMLRRYRGRLFYLDGNPFEFRNPVREFDTDMKFMREFMRAKTGLDMPYAYKDDYFRLVFLEIYCRISRYNAFLKSHKMRHMRLLDIEYPPPFNGDVQLILPLQDQPDDGDD